MCNNKIKSECHFAREWQCYQDYREIVLNHHGISTATPILGMVNLFMSSNITVLAEYICKAWERKHITMQHVCRT